MFSCQELAHEERRSRDCWRSPQLETSTLKDEYSLTSSAKSLSLAWPIQAVCQLCTDEFGITPTVVFCKRLGEERTSNTEPILVAVNSTNQAEEIITCAKSLRHSIDPTVKNNIYINPNLTKAEAHAAYLERCKRRLQQPSGRSRIVLRTTTRQWTSPHRRQQYPRPHYTAPEYLTIHYAISLQSDTRPMGVKAMQPCYLASSVPPRHHLRPLHLPLCRQRGSRSSVNMLLI